MVELLRLLISEMDDEKVGRKFVFEGVSGFRMSDARQEI